VHFWVGDERKLGIGRVEETGKFYLCTMEEASGFYCVKMILDLFDELEEMVKVMIYKLLF
jgi:hypothetical protein